MFVSATKQILFHCKTSFWHGLYALVRRLTGREPRPDKINIHCFRGAVKYQLRIQWQRVYICFEIGVCVRRYVIKISILDTFAAF